MVEEVTEIAYGQWVVGQTVGGRWYGGRFVGTRLTGHPSHGTLVEVDINPDPAYTYCVGVKLASVQQVGGYEPTWAPCTPRNLVHHAMSFNGYGVSECGKRVGAQCRQDRAALERHLPEGTVYCPQCRDLLAGVPQAA